MQYSELVPGDIVMLNRSTTLTPDGHIANTPSMKPVSRLLLFVGRRGGAACFLSENASLLWRYPEPDELTLLSRLDDAHALECPA